MHAMKPLFGLLLVLCCAAPATAAQFTIVNPDPLPLAKIAAGECSIRLSGRIEDGDAERLSKLYENDEMHHEPHPGNLEFVFSTTEPKSQSLCLDSEGGSLPEAVKLVSTIAERDLVTVLPKDSTCLSACAVAFLSGQITSYNTDGGQSTPYRVMHVSATLGFHAPYPDIQQSGGVLPVEMAIRFHEIGARTVNEIFSSLSDRDTYEATARLPVDLLMAMLQELRRDDFYYVDTVDKAGRFDIRLAGTPKISMDWDAFLRLCENAANWGFGLRGTTFPDLTIFNIEVLPDPKKSDAAAAMESRGGIRISSRHTDCTIKGRINPGDDFSVEFTTFQSGEKTRPMEPWQSLPHYVTIKQLAQSGPEFDVAAVSDKYPPQDPGAVKYGLTISELLPNHIIVLNCDAENEVYECELESGPTIIFLGADGDSEIEWPDGRTEDFTHTMQPDKVCFNSRKNPGRLFCGTIARSEYGIMRMVFDDRSLPSGEVQFMRPATQLPKE